MKLSTAQLKLLAGDIFHFFQAQDTPPADQIFVPLEQIKVDRDTEDGLIATVRFIMECAGRKVHSIRIKFKVDPRGRFLTNSWNYL